MLYNGIYLDIMVYRISPNRSPGPIWVRKACVAGLSAGRAYLLVEGGLYDV